MDVVKEDRKQAPINLSSELSVVASRPVWSLSTAAPALYQKLLASDPRLSDFCRLLAEKVPFQKTWAFGEFDGFCRPDRHVRAFYVSCRNLPKPEPGTGYIAVKGTEVFCDNFDKLIERMSRLWNIYYWGIGGATRQIFKDFSTISVLERFPVLEGKLPGAHPLWDAQEEADWALSFQLRHVNTYGEFARVPIPLFVYSWDAAIEKKISDCVMPHLSLKAKRIVESGIREGLGGYVYYYPSVPTRLIHIKVPNVGATLSLVDRIELLKKSGIDPRATVEGWIEIVARMLSLGFVATDPGNLNRGYCVHPQNMVTDGGVVDLNSLRDVDSFSNEGEVFISVTRTIQAVTQGISWLIVGTEAGADVFAERFTEVASYVSSEIWKRVGNAIASGVPVPEIIARMANQQDVYSRISGALVMFYNSCGEYRPEEREDRAYQKK